MDLLTSMYVHFMVVCIMQYVVWNAIKSSLAVQISPLCAEDQVSTGWFKVSF